MYLGQPDPVYHFAQRAALGEEVEVSHRLEEVGVAEDLQHLQQGVVRLAHPLKGWNHPPLHRLLAGVSPPLLWSIKVVNTQMFSSSGLKTRLVSELPFPREEISSFQLLLGQGIFIKL